MGRQSSPRARRRFANARGASPAARGSGRATAGRWGRAFLSVLIVGYVPTIFFLTTPSRCPLKNWFAQHTTTFLIWSGLWQGWDMFAPNPLTECTHMDAQVLMSDRTNATWTFPRMSELGFWDKQYRERYRKWGQDRIRMDEFSAA